MSDLNELVKHLERIAKANNDVFRYIIMLDKRGNNVIYTFSAEEIHDDHCFVAATSLNQVNQIPMDITEDVLKKACEEWDYKYVD